MTQDSSQHSELKKTLPGDAIEMSGTVSKFLYNAHGDCDGLILDGDKQIHFPPHLSVEVLRSMKVWDKIQVHGRKLAAIGLTIAASITLPSGTRIVDNGPPGKH